MFCWRLKAEKPWRCLGTFYLLHSQVFTHGWTFAHFTLRACTPLVVHSNVLFLLCLFAAHPRLLILYFSTVLLNCVQFVSSLTLFFFSCFASFPSKNIRYIAWKYRVIFYVREEQHFACHNYLSTDTDNCLSAPRWHEIAVNHVEYSIRTVPISSCSLSE